MKLSFKYVGAMILDYEGFLVTNHILKRQSLNLNEPYRQHTSWCWHNSELRLVYTRRFWKTHVTRQGVTRLEIVPVKQSR